MSTFIIGDIHGCYESLVELISHCSIRPSDRIWCVGDLINRGPHSHRVIEWAMSNESRLQIVLGNHELHFLACLFGAQTSSNDTLDELLDLSKSDQADILGWLRRQPLLYEDKFGEMRVAMVHAGVNSEWTWKETRRRARRAEAELQCDAGLSALATAHPSRKGEKRMPSLSKTSIDHPMPARQTDWIADLKWFTRVRALDEQNKPIGWFKGEPRELPRTLRPWFSKYEESHKKVNLSDERPNLLCYGHWAAFGIQAREKTFGLDSGCIWGRHLSALKLDTMELFQVNTVEKPLTPKNLR